MRRFGNRASAPEKSQSVSAITDVRNTKVAVTDGGASADDVSHVDPDPMCMKIAVPVSSHAAKNGSHDRAGSWIVGSPSLPGSSENATARTPRAALRRTSSAASPASHNGTMHNGTSRPPLSPAHSSTIQSLYARTHASASSLSRRSAKSWPQNRGYVGKHSDAQTWFWSMSAMRAVGS